MMVANYSASSTTLNLTASNDAPTGADAGATLAFTEGMVQVLLIQL